MPCIFINMNTQTLIFMFTYLNAMTRAFVYISKYVVLNYRFSYFYIWILTSKDRKSNLNRCE